MAKKLFLIGAMVLWAMGVMAEDSIPTTFLGVPVDGTEQEMIQNLQSKGFVYNSRFDYLTGIFNGEKVIVALRVYKGKVCQVEISNLKTYSEKQVKEKFNNLMKQYNDDPNYISATLDQAYIDGKEHISENGKNYAAYYMQITHELDTTIWMQDMDKIAQEVVEKFAGRELSEHEKDLLGIYIEQKAIRQQYLHNIVWFKILRNKKKYSIAIYYDNLYNLDNHFPTYNKQ